MENRLKYLTTEDYDKYNICSDEGLGICAAINKTVGKGRRISCQSHAGFHINDFISKDWSDFFKSFTIKSQNNYKFICNNLNTIKLTKLIANNSQINIPLRRGSAYTPFFKLLSLFNNVEKNCNPSIGNTLIYKFLALLRDGHEPEIIFFRKCFHLTLQIRNFYSFDQIMDKFEYGFVSNDDLNKIHQLIRENLLKFYQKRNKGQQFIKKAYTQLIKACSLNIDSKSIKVQKSIEKLLRPWHKKASGFSSLYNLTQELYRLKNIQDPDIYRKKIEAWNSCKLRSGVRKIIDYHLNRLPELTRYNKLSVQYQFNFQKWKRFRVVPEWINRKLRKILFNGAGFHGMQQLTRILTFLYPGILILEYFPDSLDFQIWNLPK